MNTLTQFTLITILALAVSPFFSSTAVAAPEVVEVPMSRPNVLAFHMHSEILNETMLIEVAVPLSYADTDENVQYPVSYTGDASLLFLMASTDNIRGSFMASFVPEMITVGFDFLDYSDECKRSQWHTPASIPDDEDCGEVGGGADQFLDFIRYELKPFLNTTFRIDENQEVLAGHSHTATLSLYSLFTQPDLFDMYIAASPSLYWADEIMFQYEQDFASNHKSLDKPVYISVGLNEVGNSFPDPEDNALANEIVFSYVYRMGRKLKQDFPNSPIRLQAFPNEDHGSVAGKALHQGIHFVFTGE